MIAEKPVAAICFRKNYTTWEIKTTAMSLSFKNNAN